MQAHFPSCDRILEPHVLALWGASGRGEATAGSDVDLLLWSPQRESRELQETVSAVQAAWAGYGQYVDLLEYDGSRTLHEWARSTATDLQAVLFASSPHGDPELVDEFERLQRELWLDLRLRAREAWLLSAEMLRRPQIMARAGHMHRPEKFTPGATRSFTALGEVQSLVSGSGGARPTLQALTAVERELDISDGRLRSAYERSLAIRQEVEAGKEADRYVDDWERLSRVAMEALREYVLSKIQWLQAHSGVDTEIASAHLKTLFGGVVGQIAQPKSRDPETESMLQAFNLGEPGLSALVKSGRTTWTTAFAATANPECGADTLRYLVFPPFPVDAHDWRNIWLWSLRHPNLPRDVARRFLEDKGHREMDYRAAQVALQGSTSSEDLT